MVFRRLLFNYLPSKIINIPSWVWVSAVGLILGVFFFFVSSNDFLLWISNVYLRIKSMLPTWGSLVINLILVYFLLLILIQLIVGLKIFPRYIVKILENSVPTIGSIFINVYSLVNNNKTVLKITAKVKPQSSNCQLSFFATNLSEKTSSILYQGIFKKEDDQYNLILDNSKVYYFGNHKKYNRNLEEVTSGGSSSILITSIPLKNSDFNKEIEKYYIGYLVAPSERVYEEIQLSSHSHSQTTNYKKSRAYIFPLLGVAIELLGLTICIFTVNKKQNNENTTYGSMWVNGKKEKYKLGGEKYYQINYTNSDSDLATVKVNSLYYNKNIRKKGKKSMFLFTINMQIKSKASDIIVVSDKAIITTNEGQFFENPRYLDGRVPANYIKQDPVYIDLYKTSNNAEIKYVDLQFEIIDKDDIQKNYNYNIRMKLNKPTEGKY